MSKYGPIEYKGFIAPCRFCGSPGCIMGWEDGIGDVMCSNPDCLYKSRKIHYSGKFHMKKREAIRRWNYDQVTLAD